jgi:hypothetical protein
MSFFLISWFSDILLPDTLISWCPFARYSSPPKVKKCKKSVQKWLISCNFCSKHVHFWQKMQKNANFC